MNYFHLDRFCFCVHSFSVVGSWCVTYVKLHNSVEKSVSYIGYAKKTLEWLQFSQSYAFEQKPPVLRLLYLICWRRFGEVTILTEQTNDIVLGINAAYDVKLHNSACICTSTCHVDNADDYEFMFSRASKNSLLLTSLSMHCKINECTQAYACFDVSVCASAAINKFPEVFLFSSNFIPLCWLHSLWLLFAI